MFRSALFWALVAVIILVTLLWWPRGGTSVEELSLDDFEEYVADGRVETAIFHQPGTEITGELSDGREYRTRYPGEYGDELTAILRDASPSVEVTVEEHRQSLWLGLFLSLLPVLLLILVFLAAFHFLGGGGRMGQFGRAKARQVTKDQPKVTFSDVAGSDEAVEELREIKEFLEEPGRFHAIGAKIPKGVLLFGPPGTGKTLLARAVAGEAGVPFFSISGSDFVEMFVGVGASRVRDLFQQAKAAAPAIIFVDEIDAVGRHRGAGLGGGHDEREQTLNQLLVEMDGFDLSSGVILIAATNRPDILDPALLRPGRFDRQIVVDRPDLEGRKAILAVHASGKPLDPSVNLETIARRTPGFTGADLSNLMNEAALLAARRGLVTVSHLEIEDAIDRVLAGPERKSRVLGDHEQRVIAYHEAGHALVGHTLQHTDPIHKVSIIARGRALGWTLALPEQDKYLKTRSQLRDELAMLLGGRTAEEMIFGDPTTGAADDIDRATKLARAMVCDYGMSERLGPRKLGTTRGEVFLGKDLSHEADYSDDLAARIDDEVNAFLEIAHEEARALLTHHREVLDSLAEALLEHETLDERQLAEIFAGLEHWTGRPEDAGSPSHSTVPGGYGQPSPQPSGLGGSSGYRATTSEPTDPPYPEQR
ncbi:MAG: ATP-dependent zinc metalloprotease FtsH [Acidimicrobiales bacterium]|nr:ATP-dependent zinc metalloprotease FtsH [Acidimicrobiales bacterium]